MNDHVIRKKAIEKRRTALINELIQNGIYKKGEQHLYDLTLTDLEKEWRSLQETKKKDAK
ncbi:Fur-regulated basic protein FbpA [Scopulibacillus cellulosilyticus]|uniref:Fur-regulated basic protein FbpA n=1 Tax=Scopulibacillus cellulosilyticus TaxID=2665665 RepID=A0ABW2PZX9_9BACL